MGQNLLIIPKEILIKLSYEYQNFISYLKLKTFSVIMFFKIKQ